MKNENLLRTAPKLTSLVEYLDSLEAPADISVTQQLLEESNVTRADVGPLCQFQRDTYSRNVIAKTEHYELCLICWHPGHGSSIHDHNESSCALKILDGIATETQFEVTTHPHVRPVSCRTLACGEVCASIRDETIHQVINNEEEGCDLVTLHIYSPPLEMNTFQLDASVKVEESEFPAVDVR